MEGKTAVFKITYSRNATIGGIALALLLSIPLVLLSILGSEGPIYFLVSGAVLVLLPGFVIFLTFEGRNMSHEIGNDDIRVRNCNSYSLLVSLWLLFGS